MNCFLPPPLRYLAISSLASLLFVGCAATAQDPGAHSKDTQAEPGGPGGKADLVGQAEESRKAIDFRLGFAERENIAHTAYEVTIDRQGRSELPNTRIDVRFDDLDASQYQALMDHYGGQGVVPWMPDRTYRLVDFLPPKVQALVDRWLVVTSEDLALPEDWCDPRRGCSDVVTGMNCWDTAYSVLFDLHKPMSEQQGAIFHIGPLDFEKALEAPEASTFTRNLTREEVFSSTSPSRNEGLEPGDLLYIRTKFSMIGPAHVAIFIDDDLYFEKTNFSSEDPIRLARWSDVVGPYLEQDDPERPVTMKVIRTRGGAPLPHPKSFTGRYPYPEYGGTSPLPNGLDEKLVFTLDAGLGGGLTEFGISRLHLFGLAPDAAQRVEMVGADAISASLGLETICTASATDAPFAYSIDRGPILYVRRAADGTEVARIPGTFGETDTSIDLGGRTAKAYFTFTSGTGTTIVVHETEYSTFALTHPGQAERVDVDCIQDPPFLGHIYE